MRVWVWLTMVMVLLVGCAAAPLETPSTLPPHLQVPLQTMRVGEWEFVVSRGWGLIHSTKGWRNGQLLGFVHVDRDGDNPEYVTYSVRKDDVVAVLTDRMDTGDPVFYLLYLTDKAGIPETLIEWAGDPRFDMHMPKVEKPKS